MVDSRRQNKWIYKVNNKLRSPRSAPTQLCWSLARVNFNFLSTYSLGTQIISLFQKPLYSLITLPKIKILAWNFQDIMKGVPWDHLGNLTSSGPTYPHLARTLHDHGHQYIAHPFNTNKYIDLKLSGYDHRVPLRSGMKPKLTWSNLISPSQELNWPQLCNYSTQL